MTIPKPPFKPKSKITKSLYHIRNPIHKLSKTKTNKEPNQKRKKKKKQNRKRGQRSTATNGGIANGGGGVRGSLSNVPLMFDTQTQTQTQTKTQTQKQRPKPRNEDQNTFGTKSELLAWNNSSGGDVKLENPQPNVSMALI